MSINALDTAPGTDADLLTFVHGCSRSSPAAHARCRLPVASIANTGTPACLASIFSKAAIPERATGNDTGSSSRPLPSLTQTRFITLPGSIATTTDESSRATTCSTAARHSA